MRWMVSIWQLALAAVFVAVLGLAAGASHAGERVVPADGGSATWQFSFGGGHGGFRDEDRRRHKRRKYQRERHRRYHGQNRGRVVFVDPWYRPWPNPPRTVVIERPVAVPAPRPTRTGTGPEIYCREFQKKIIIDGRTEQAHGVACRQPDGTWKLQP